jgi:release factor glutamine methyltransferase
MTILEIIKKTTRFFQDRGIESPRLNAERLLAYVLGQRRLDLYLHFDKPLHKREIDKMRALVKRRGRLEPLQYVMGECAFMDITVRVNPDVLIPRPETEILVETVISDFRDQPDKRVLDIGTGSGIIAICIKRALPGFQVAATDISRKILDTARQNGEKAGVNVTWAVSDLFASLDKTKYDIIVSNPPYVKTGDIQTLALEIKDYEPLTALDGGEDGLQFYVRFFKQAPDFLKPGGRIYLEVGDGQAGEVAAMAEQYGMSVLKTVNDLSGKERVVVVCHTLGLP